MSLCQFDIGGGSPITTPCLSTRTRLGSSLSEMKGSCPSIAPRYRWGQEAREREDGWIVPRPVRKKKNKQNKCVDVKVESRIERSSSPLPLSDFPFPFLFSLFFPLFSFFLLCYLFFLINSSHGTVERTSFTSWTITIATTTRTCLMAAHMAFIRLSRRRISTWSTHSKASTPIQSCPPPLPRVGTIHPRVVISKPTSKLLSPFQNSSRLFRCGP